MFYVAFLLCTAGVFLLGVLAYGMPDSLSGLLGWLIICLTLGFTFSMPVHIKTWKWIGRNYRPPS